MDIDTVMHDKDAAGPLATDLLRADHALLRRLFEQYQDAGGEEAGTRQIIAQEICMQLELHSRVELELFYPAVGDEDAGFIDMAIEHHAEMAEAIGEIRELPAASDEYDDLVLTLRGIVDDHLTEEEEVLFPELEERMPETLVALTDEIIELKERIVGSTEDLEGRA